jgi:hypothetical protein
MYVPISRNPKLVHGASYDAIALSRPDVQYNIGKIMNGREETKEK